MSFIAAIRFDVDSCVTRCGSIRSDICVDAATPIRFDDCDALGRFDSIQFTTSPIRVDGDVSGLSS